MAETFAMDLDELQSPIAQGIPIAENSSQSEESTKEVSGIDSDHNNNAVSSEVNSVAQPGQFKSLKGLAELDCCVTVVDASNLITQLNSIKRVQVGSFRQLYFAFSIKLCLYDSQSLSYSSTLDGCLTEALRQRKT